MQFYTHIANQYAPFHTRVINVEMQDATYVLDGLFFHESCLDVLSSPFREAILTLSLCYLVPFRSSL